MSVLSTPRVTFLGAVIAMAVGLVLAVAVSEVALRIAMPEWREFNSLNFFKRITTPGHATFSIGKPGFDGYFAQNNGDFRHHIKINAFGLRNDEPVAAAQDRLWVIGDSMAFGWGVERHETYTAVIARLSGQPTYSVAGPGNDVCGYQALIDRMPDGIKPRAAIVGLVLENDVRAYDCQAKAAASARTGMSETVSFFNLGRLKKTLTIHSAFYNVLAVSLKRVPMINQLMMSLGLVSREHVVRYALDTAGLGQRIEKTAEAVTKLKAMLPPGIPFAVFLAPARFEIRDNHPFYAEVRHKITAALTARGVAVIDPYLAFRELGFEVVYFPHDGHWAAAGHQVAGATVAAWLESQ